MTVRSLTVVLSDGSTHIITPTLEDTLRFETTLRKNKSWGPLADNALRMQPFRAWSYLSRTGVIDLTWEEFTKGTTAALEVNFTDQPDDDDEDEELAVDGVGKDTKTGQRTRSSSPSPSAPTSSPAAGD